MSRFAYDLHSHSCLSPCADDLSTPANLAGMAAVNGLQLVALTDHNSCGNLAAFFKACGTYPSLIPIAGIELNTAEEIHLLCLFPALEAALAFDEAIAPYRSEIQNRPDIFGHQWRMDEEDTRLEDIPELLIPATTLPLYEANDLVRQYGGVAIPAHIDRDANGILSILGGLPETPAFHTLEIRDKTKAAELIAKHHLENKRILFNSDAHQLKSLHDNAHYLDLPCPPDAPPADIAAALIHHLRT